VPTLYGGGGGCNTPNNSNVGQRWSKWNWYLPKVGQNRTDICLKLKVKLGKIWSKFGIKMVEVAQSYEMDGNFNNFKAFVMFAVKKLEALLILVENFEYAYVGPEKLF
jgi:hypothetical protein